MSNDYETGWHRTDRLLINLIKSLKFQDCLQEKEKIQNLIDEITNKKKQSIILVKLDDH